MTSISTEPMDVPSESLNQAELGESQAGMKRAEVHSNDEAPWPFKTVGGGRRYTRRPTIPSVCDQVEHLDEDNPAPPDKEYAHRGTTRSQSRATKIEPDDSKLLNFIGGTPLPKTVGGRNYNYKEMYDPDPKREETGSDARVFKVYNDETDKYDQDMIRTFRDTLDVLLVFAALFSAVVTTLLGQTSQALQTDQAQVTNYLLIEQIHLLRTTGDVAGVPPSILQPDSRTYTYLDVWINGLFFTSLALSLATALLSVLAKQWLQAYMASTSGSARDIALVRHLRLAGFKKYKVHEIIGALPLILHLSLVLFSVGFCMFIYSLLPRLVWIVIAISGLTFAFYFGSIFVPAIDISCPYRIPVLFPATVLFITTFLGIPKIARRVWRVFRRGNQASEETDNSSSSRSHWSIKDAELSVVDEASPSMPPLVQESVLWLHNVSSNKTVRQIACWSIAGKHFLPGVFSRHDREITSLIRNGLGETLFRSLFDRDCIPEDSLNIRSLNTLRSIFIVFHLPLVLPHLDRYLHYAARSGYMQHAEYLLTQWSVDVNALVDSETALYAAAAAGHTGIVRLLIDKGADMKVEGAYGSALQAASVGGHIEVVRLLLDNGMDVNLKGGHFGSALQAASRGGQIEVMRLLLENGADVDLEGGNLGPALQAASRGGETEAVRLLLENGADVDLKDEPLGSALQAASYWGHIEVVVLLLEYGADINLKGGRYGSPLRAAMQGNEPGIEALLRAHGAVDL